MFIFRKGSKVYFGKDEKGQELTINAQATKGAGKEVVDIEGLAGSNGQKWLSLTKIKEGLNEFNSLKGREVTSTGATRAYTLTEAEKAEVKKHQDAIDKIIEAAKARYVPVPVIKGIDPSAMTELQKLEKIIELKKYLGNDVSKELKELENLKKKA
jgi:hypothetical protein